MKTCLMAKKFISHGQFNQKKYQKMRVLIIVTLIALAKSQLPDSRCPSGTPNPPLHLNDPTNCTIFFTCVGGNAFPQPCPPGIKNSCKIKYILSFVF